MLFGDDCEVDTLVLGDQVVIVALDLLALEILEVVVAEVMFGTIFLTEAGGLDIGLTFVGEDCVAPAEFASGGLSFHGALGAIFWSRQSM
jgi:hypothetical protein